jgi:hypothetical protein
LGEIALMLASSQLLDLVAGHDMTLLKAKFIKDLFAVLKGQKNLHDLARLRAK